MSKILKKPVHVALLRPTQLQKLVEEGKIVSTPFGVDPNSSKQPLPKEEKPTVTKTYIPNMDVVKRSQNQVKLRVIHNNVPPIPKDKQPPCGTCKTSACCYVFTVNITELEYESGLYGEAAVKLTPEMYQQLSTRYNSGMMLTAPRIDEETGYFLEGRIGEPCSFLTKDNKCGIYDIRPITCRVYTCVGDSRITEGMRQGIEGIDALSVLQRMNKD